MNWRALPSVDREWNRVSTTPEESGPATGTRIRFDEGLGRRLYPPQVGRSPRGTRSIASNARHEPVSRALKPASGSRVRPPCVPARAGSPTAWHRPREIGVFDNPRPGARFAAESTSVSTSWMSKVYFFHIVK